MRERLARGGVYLRDFLMKCVTRTAAWSRRVGVGRWVKKTLIATAVYVVVALTAGMAWWYFAFHGTPPPPIDINNAIPPISELTPGFPSGDLDYGPGPASGHPVGEEPSGEPEVTAPVTAPGDTDVEPAAGEEPPEVNEPEEMAEAPVTEEPGTPLLPEAPSVELPVFAVTPAAWEQPVRNTVAAKVFGFLHNTTTHDARAHSGVDYAGPTGTPVYAANAGKVIIKKDPSGLGQVVCVEHDGGYELYAGINPSVTAGKYVVPGKVLGTIGSPPPIEMLDGPHLHFEIRESGKPIDPQTVMSQ